MNSHPKILPSKYQFLPRSLQISSGMKNVFRKIYIKRFSIKNFADQRREYNNGTKDFACKLIKDKCFKALRTISLSSVSQDYLRKNLKTCKNIKRIQITSEIEMDKLTMILKKLSKNVQKIQLKDFIFQVPTQTKTFMFLPRRFFDFLSFNISIVMLILLATRRIFKKSLESITSFLQD